MTNIIKLGVGPNTAESLIQGLFIDRGKITDITVIATYEGDEVRMGWTHKKQSQLVLDLMYLQKAVLEEIG